MHKLISKIVTSILLCLALTQIAQADLSAEVNRTQFSPRDTILLTLETTEPIDSALNTTPLLASFLVLDQKKMTINSYAEGKRSSVVRWQLQLRARKSGQLEIPSLSYNNEQTDAISVFIKSSNTTRFLPVSDQPVILDAQISQDDVYESALILYTLNLYSDRPLTEGYELTLPKMSSANIKLLAQNNIKKVAIRGREYDVLEQFYAVYPSEMGRFIIEGPVFNGSQIESSEIQARANNLEINVKSRQDFENAKYWLPATNATLKEAWQKSDETRVGDTIVREVTLTVTGIAAENLPSLINNNPDIVDVLDTQVALSDKVSKQGIEGTRKERQTIKLLERGEVTFPKIEVFWWDTANDNQQSSVLAKQILTVLPGVNGESSIEREKAQNTNNNQDQPNITVIETQSSWLLWLLFGLLLISIAGWLYYLRKTKRSKEKELEGFNQTDASIAQNSEQLSAHDEQAFAPEPSPITQADNSADLAQDEPLITDNSINEEENYAKNFDLGDPHITSEFDITSTFNAKAELSSFQTLGRACLQNDLPVTKECLLDWANTFWHEQSFYELSDVAQIINNPSFNVLLAEMEDLLESGDSEQWQGKQLFNLLTAIRAN